MAVCELGKRCFAYLSYESRFESCNRRGAPGSRVNKGHFADVITGTAMSHFMAVDNYRYPP